MRRTPALIVGGGPAGASLAFGLASAGLPHLLIERARETADTLCGGFLSWRTLASLEAMGIDGAMLNPAPITRVRLFGRNRTAEAPLPGLARAVSRRRLDTLLLAAADRAGAAIERGVGVRAIEGDTVRLDDAATLTADALFLASGKHDTRGAARPVGALAADPTLGLRLRLDAGPALDRLVGDAIELHLFDGGYAGLVRQEDGSGNLCLAVRRSRLRDAGDPERLLLAIAAEVPPLGARLALRAGGAIDAVANVPYGWRATDTQAGLFRLGDQAGVIPSLAGEGMGIAIASAAAAVAAYRGGGADAARSFQQDFAQRLRRPIGVASIAWRLAERPVLAAGALRFAGITRPLLPVLARWTRV